MSTHRWAKWLDLSSQGSDLVHWYVFFIAKVNVKDINHLLVSSQSLDKASIPVLHITEGRGEQAKNLICVYTKICISSNCYREFLLTLSKEN